MNFAQSLVLIVCSCAIWVSGATYYISSTGSDANTPTQAQNQSTSWRTIDRINSQAFSAGDKILFKCGDTLRGNIENTNQMSYGSYGTGAKPVISGSIPVTGWSLSSGSIYVTTVDATVKGVVINGRRMTLA